MSQITLTLPYPISANRYWRPVKVGQHITIVPTKEAKLYRNEVAALYRGPLVTGRCLFEVFLFPNRPQDWQKRHAFQRVEQHLVGVVQVDAHHSV